MWTIAGVPIAGHFEHDGIAYPANWLALSTDAEKAEIGVVWQEPAPEPPPTQQDYAKSISSEISRLAVARGYDSEDRLVGYVTSTNPTWSGEAQAFIAWRDAVWAYAYQELGRVAAGERSQPTVQAFISELPAIVWPSKGDE